MIVMAVAVAGVLSGTSFATTYAPARHGKKPSRKWKKAQITLTEKMMGTTNQKLTKAAKIKVAKTMREYGENMLKVSYATRDAKAAICVAMSQAKRKK
jgi:hypothetical protein